jgi:sarcosine oxidase
LKHEYDAIVLGLGGIGSGTIYWLSRRGANVLGIEQFELGHARGSSHDHSRIIRLSYHAAHYVALAKEAYAAWEMLSGDSGERLVFQTGGLDLGPFDGAISLDSYALAMSACDVAFEELDGAQIRRRFPPFRVGDDVRGLFQEKSGIVAAERATSTHQRMAKANGATLLERTRVERITDDAGEITVEAGRNRYRSGRLIVAAGPWTNHVLAHFGIRLPLDVTKEQVMYFRPQALEPFQLGRFPIWIWMDSPSFYGFPTFGEAGAVKVTQDAGGKIVDARTRDFLEDPEITQRVRSFLSANLPTLDGDPCVVKTCLYTLTPDRDFIIDAVPEHPHVFFAVGAGHAFKFACVMGRILAELALDGKRRSDIAAFAATRPILNATNPPKTYMV